MPFPHCMSRSGLGWQGQQTLPFYISQRRWEASTCQWYLSCTSDFKWLARTSFLTMCPAHTVAEKTMQRDLTLRWSKFRPNVVVREVMLGNPDFTRRSLSSGAKRLVDEEAYEERRNHLLSLEKEGQMFRNTSTEAAEIWGNTLIEIPDEQRKFALNSAVDTLPHNANLHLWRKRGDDSCPLCGGRQTLIYVLNTCPVALQSRRYI